MTKKVRFSDKVMIRYYNPMQKNAKTQQKKQYKYIILVALISFLLVFFYLY